MDAQNQQSHSPENNHTYFQSLLFQAKAAGLRILRSAKDRLNKIPTHPKSSFNNPATLLACVSTPLWDLTHEREIKLTAGKVHNLRIAATALNGVLIAQNQIFSFWSQLGRLTRSKGYVPGREIQAGCVVPSIGGGICQLTNSLYEAALKSGCEILERHGHTRKTAQTPELDATVFWNYVDLRFRARQEIQLQIHLDEDFLHVRFFGQQPSGVLPAVASHPSDTSHAKSCETCDNVHCHKMISSEKGASALRKGYLLDEYWPEFDAWILSQKKQSDFYLIPLNGQRFKKSNYAWSPSILSHAKTTWFQTLKWSRKMRGLAAQGALRQRALLRRDEELAHVYAKKLPTEVRECTISQNLLAPLWKTGILGGRSFQVLMTRLPLKILQMQLDEAAALLPEAKTLRDFRDTSNLMEVEWEALQAANAIITPHQHIATIFPEKTIHLPWQLPLLKNRKWTKGRRVIFPATTAARKGAYWVREIVKELGCELVVVGGNVEGKNFWEGINLLQKSWAETWWDQAGLVILPAFIEFKPRALLLAQALGLPIIASQACGVSASEGVTVFPTEDKEAFFKCVREQYLKLRSL